MARPKAFDPDFAVQRAMETFWTSGYAATSTQDLVVALGINRSSLYGTFGSKHALYQRALERYGQTQPDWARVLDGPGPFRDRLRAALMHVVDEDLDPKGGRGCFACNAAVELGPVDSSVRRLVRRALANTRREFRRGLVRAREDGELPATADLEALATFLVTAFEGLRVIAKGTRDRRLLEQSVDATIAALP